MTDEERKIFKKIKRAVKKIDGLTVYPDGDGESVVEYLELTRITFDLKKQIEEMDKVDKLSKT